MATASELVIISPVSTPSAFEVIEEDDVASSPTQFLHEKPVRAGCCACVRRRRNRGIDANSQRRRGCRLKDHQNTAKHCIVAYLRYIWIDSMLLALFGILILGLHFAPNNFRNPPLMPFWTQVPLVGNLTINMDLRAPIEFLYPYRKSPLSDLVCAVIVTIVPIIVIALFQLRICSVWDFHAGQTGILKAVTTTTLIVLIFKLYIGGFRPHFFDVCRPNMTLLNEQIAHQFQNHTSLYFNSTVCTGDKTLVKNALQSFPSGHSANSFAAAIFLALYMNAKLKTIGDHASHYWAFVLTITPLILASMLSALMYITHQHHMSDLYAGAVTGLIIGAIAYRSAYAAIFDSRYNHIPLPPFAAKTRFTYSGGRSGSGNETDMIREEEIDRLVFWSWWKGAHGEQNREREEFWLRNIRSTKATGCERGFGSKPTLPRNGQDAITRDRTETRYNLTSEGIVSMPQYSSSPASPTACCGGVEGDAECQV